MERREAVWRWAVFLCLFTVFGSIQTQSGQLPWNEALGQQYLYYSYTAYCNTTQIIEWDCKWCQQPSIESFVPTAFPYDRHINGYGYIGYNPQNSTIVVTFRGTDSLKNWIIDLQSAEKVPYKNLTGIDVGKGFYDEWNDLLPQVIPAVQSLRTQFPNYDIYVTGHSLGAAISVLCALELVEEGYDNVYVYNYGCPRVGNENFATYYNQLVPNTYRVINGKDVVPHVPPEYMGFRHPPTEVWENPADGFDFKVCSTTNGEDPTCSDSILFPDSIYDHLHYFNVYENCHN
jgi:hypothetical protein